MGKIYWHQIILVVVLLVTGAWGMFFKGWSFDMVFLLRCLGIVIGFLFVFGDRMVYSLVTNKDEYLSKKVGELFRGRKILEGISLLVSERGVQDGGLVMRSAFFVVVWLILGIFSVTSVADGFARGLILGIGTHVIFDLFWDYLGKGRLIETWLWHVKRKLSEKEIRLFVAFSGFVYLVIALGL